MSASMCVVRRSRLLSKLTTYSRLRCRHTASCTYVLLPEVPPDTPETNTLMRVDELPEWSKITPSSVYRACGKLAIMYEMDLGEHCSKLQDLSIRRTFDDVFNPIEKITVPLQYAYKSVKHLSLVKKKTFSDPFEGIYAHVHRTQNERWQSEILYNSIKELNANREALSDEQKSVVDMYLREGKQAGVQLVGRQRELFEDHQRELVKMQDSFRRGVYFSSQTFKETVYEDSAIEEMPEAVQKRLSLNKDIPEAGPWLFTIRSSAVYKPIMSYCPDRTLRRKVWEALYTTGSVSGASSGISNKKALQGIRYARMNMAKLVGYSNYAEMAMRHRMAGGVQEVMEFIETLRSAFRPEAEEELAIVQQFAQSHGFMEKLDLWDMDYWSRRHREDLYQVNLHEPSEYFPLNRVLSGLFQICQGLFSIEIKRRQPGTVDVWHPSVEIFDIFDERGQERGTFFMDPFKRYGDKYAGSWGESGRQRSGLLGVLPVSYIAMNLNPTVGKQPTLMSFHEVAELFSMMGHILQQLLTTADMSEISGQQNVEWDAVHVSAYVMRMWLMRGDTLRSLSYHWETGKQLDADEVDTIIAAANHMYSSRLMKRLYDSVYDLEMHVSETHFDTAMRRIWPRYMIHSLDKMYSEPTSMLNVFTENRQAAGLYGLLWSEMVAADVMKSFNECKSIEELQTSGLRFKDTFLSLGGSVSASEVFRRFKGHDPSFSSFIELRLPGQMPSTDT